MEAPYCVEQLRIPPELPRVLREWAKALLAEQPADPRAFSAKWFASKAALAASNFAATRFAPTHDMLRGLWDALPDQPTADQLRTALTDVGVPKAAMDALMRLESEPTKTGTLALCAAFSAGTPTDVLRMVAEVTGGLMPQQVQEVLETLGRHDPRITAATLRAVQTELGTWPDERADAAKLIRTLGELLN